MKVLVIHGPNLNMLGKREASIYGDQSLANIDSALNQLAAKLNVDLTCIQSNSEGAIIDSIQAQAAGCHGIIINPGALTHYSYALRDALADSPVPIVEIHLSNIYAREPWRAHSVIAPIARGQISGFGWRGYLIALEALVNDLKAKT